jgi:hypothetical protein
MISQQGTIDMQLQAKQSASGETLPVLDFPFHESTFVKCKQLCVMGADQSPVWMFHRISCLQQQVGTGHQRAHIMAFIHLDCDGLTIHTSR